MFDDAKITQRLKLQKKICLSVFFSVHLFSKKVKGSNDYDIKKFFQRAAWFCAHGGWLRGGIGQYMEVSVSGG